MGIITEYIDAAMRAAEYGELEGDEGFVGTIPALDGLIGHAGTLKLCEQDLREALEGWLLVSLQHQMAVPPKWGIDLRVAEQEVA